MPPLRRAGGRWPLSIPLLRGQIFVPPSTQNFSSLESDQGIGNVPHKRGLEEDKLVKEGKANVKIGGYGSSELKDQQGQEQAK